MSEPITVPGDIPGLLRPFAPLIAEADPEFGYDEPIRGTIVGIDPFDVAWADYRPSEFGLVSYGRSLGPIDLTRLSMLLSEPLGRDIAARWMAEKLGIEVGLTAPVFEHIDGNVTGGPSGWSLQGAGGSPGFFRAFLATASTKPLACDIVVSGLPLDPTKGPEAMRMIILALAGRLP